jgi:hypothetical protein
MIVCSTFLKLALHLREKGLHLFDLAINRSLLLLILFVNDVEILLGALLEALCLLKRVSHALVVLNQCTLHGAYSVKVTQILALVIEDLTFSLCQVVGDCVDLVQGIIPHLVDIELEDFVIYERYLSLLFS